MDPNIDFSLNIESSDSTITTLTAVNGANLASPYTGRDLSWTIFSQTGAVGGSGNYFYLDVTNRDDISTCRLKNNLVDTLPPDNYQVILRVQDAGGAYDEVIISISNSVEVLSVKEYNFTVGFENYFFTIIEANYPADQAKQGFYVWLGSWSNLVSSSDGFTISLDYTNSAKIGCPVFPNKWIFKNLEHTAISQAAECSSPGYIGGTTSTNIDFSSYSFQIV